MEGPFARPIGLARKSTLDSIAVLVDMMSAVLGEPVSCGRTVPYSTTRPEILPDGNYCVGLMSNNNEQFMLASRLVFKNNEDSVVADYRSIRLGNLDGPEAGADAITVFEQGMDVAHNRRTTVTKSTDNASRFFLVNLTAIFPPIGSVIYI